MAGILLKKVAEIEGYKLAKEDEARVVTTDEALADVFVARVADRVNIEEATLRKMVAEQKLSYKNMPDVVKVMDDGNVVVKVRFRELAKRLWADMTPHFIEDKKGGKK